MKELSIFIDESGDFGELKERPSYYIVTMIYHNQSIDISEDIEKLDDSIRQTGLGVEYIHTGPVIRREEGFANFSIDERRKLIYKIFNFYNKCDIYHDSVIVDRKEAVNKEKLISRLAKEIRNNIEAHRNVIDGYDKVIVYYDNGQTELSSVLNAVFSLLIKNVEFRKAEPQKYRLLQVADFVCSMELLKIKFMQGRLSKSEEKFFYKPQELKKTFFKALDKKKL